MNYLIETASLNDSRFKANIPKYSAMMVCMGSGGKSHTFLT